VHNIHIKSQSLIKATSSLGTPILGPCHMNFLTFKLSCLPRREGLFRKVVTGVNRESSHSTGRSQKLNETTQTLLSIGTSAQTHHRTHWA
jgi:hypothetical protein